jgi:hypothetical protein
MGCGCGGKKFSSAPRRSPSVQSTSNNTGRVIASQDVRVGSPVGAVPLIKRTTV